MPLLRSAEEGNNSNHMKLMPLLHHLLAMHKNDKDTLGCCSLCILWEEGSEERERELCPPFRGVIFDADNPVLIL